MREGQSSDTAERVAVERAAHQLLDSPLVFADPLALLIIDPQHAAQLRDQPTHHDRFPLAKYTRAIVVARSRIAEDEIARAAANGVDQCVVLGAGFDTFAYRNPHEGLRIFEVDHPSTQAAKRERLRQAGIAVPDNMTFVACDFAHDLLAETMERSDFDRHRPTVVSWLGVVMYLDHDDVTETLRYIASFPTGTSVVFDYVVPAGGLSWMWRGIYRRALDVLEARGEPWKSFFEPEMLRAMLETMGFTQVEDVGHEAIDQRWYANRADGLRSPFVGRIATARK